MTKTAKFLDQLNPEQKAAVEQIEGPLLVIAGPGTGKTQLLSARVANILLQTDTNPENILCLTFTEAGASAMRERLHRLMGPASTKVNISTYHAFGSDIIHLYNNFVAQPARLLETPIESVRQHKIITTLQASLPHNDILKNAKVSDLIASISEAKTARLSAADLRKIVETNLADSQKINTGLAPILQPTSGTTKYDKVVAFYDQARTKLAKFAHPEPITGKVEPLGNSLLDSLNDALESQANLDKPSSKPLTAWRNAFFEKDHQKQFVLKNQIAHQKLISLANLLELYDQYLAKNGLFDFADMIEEAIRYLRQDDAFRYSVQERYQYVLLDEFQDTNDSQLELIRLIADYDRPNIMAVGDDDQAIYAFQGARYSNLMDFKETFNAQVIVLTINYRSGQPLIDLGAQVAGQISERFATKYGINKQLTSFAASVSSPESETSLERINFISQPSEYSWVAGQISELVQNGIDQKSIAVIAPRHRYLEALVPYFAAHPEIKLSYEKRENILESPQIAPLIKLSRLIVNLAKVRPTAPDILEILSFPFWNINPLAALQSVHAAKEKHASILGYLQTSEDPKIQKLADFFATLALRSLDTPLEIMLDYLLGTTPLDDFRSPYLQYYADQNNLETVWFYENLTVLREQVRNYTSQDQLRLHHLVDLADDYAAAEQKLINTSPYQESTDAVKLVSAHGVKGLEFDYVFLISLDNHAWGTSKGNNNTLVLPKNLEFMRHTGATEDEKLRLFFVAITRARHNLIMTTALKDFAGKPLVPLKYLQETADLSPFLPPDQQQIISVTEDRPAPLALAANWSGCYNIRDAEIRTVLQKSMENYRLTATDLTTFLNIINAGPEELYVRRVLKSPQASSLNLTYGTLVHATLDKITREKINNSAAIEFYRQSAVQADVPAEDRDQLIQKGIDNLKIYLHQRGDFLRIDGHLSEVAFPSENLTSDGVPLRGKIDHLIVDEAAKSLTILDFKTGKYYADSWNSNPTLFNYKLQLQFYRLLLESSLKYRNYQINQAIIDFVKPDQDGQVHQRDLVLKDDEMAEFKVLCQKVYQKIHTLDFPDTSSYSKTLRGVKDFIADSLRN